MSRIAVPQPVLAFGIALCVVGCGFPMGGSDVGPSRSKGPRVVTTVSMVTDLVREIGGDRIEVIGLMGEGVDPHLYKPTTRDVKEVSRADAVFYCGLMLEGRMQDVLEKVRAGGKPVHAVTESIDAGRLRSPGAFAGHHDPHVWMDVALWSDCVETVVRRLSELDREGHTVYRSNGDRVRGELAELDSYVREVIGTIPERRRVLVTAHDAFGYFGKAYGIGVRSAQGISTESEPGVHDINRLVDFLVERRIAAVFVESSVPASNVRAVVEGAAGRGWRVEIGPSLYSDAMGAAGTYEGTYIGMIDHNATAIARSLGGRAPERGRLGLLAESIPASDSGG